MTNQLEVNGVSKSFLDKTALDDVSLSIAPGRVYGLLGPNGAGKTTLLRIINQITYPDIGEVLFNGRPLESKDVQRIGYMPEERGLYKSMKVGEQALYLAQLKGLPLSEAKKQLKYWFEKFDITAWWDKKIESLSKGMAQKVQFIVTVLHRPELLIFDEPFSGFDPVNAQLIGEEIINLKNEGATIIFSTHRMESVETMCDDIALINNSKKIIEGPIKDIKLSFKNNEFKVELVQVNHDAFENLKQEYSIQPIHFKSVQEGVQFIIKPKNDIKEVNQIIRDLMLVGHPVLFEELVPTIEEIFIKSVHA